jgi:hypothetical protein
MEELDDPDDKKYEPSSDTPSDDADNRLIRADRYSGIYKLPPCDICRVI